MLISWRRPPEQHNPLCLPCAACGTCLCLLSVPPTLCFGMLLAAAKASRRQPGASPGTRAGGANFNSRRQSGRGASSLRSSAAETLSLEAERRLWLRALQSAFGDCGLSDVGPIVWRFLDDQPRALRVVAADGSVRDLPLRGWRPSAALPPPIGRGAVGKALGFLPGKVVHSAGHMLALTDLKPSGGRTGQGSGVKGSTLLEGHHGDVMCFAVASEGGQGQVLATGSADMTVRLWRGSTCLQTFVSQEWSEWTGTMYIGHVTTITAVCVTTEGHLASGDRFGAVCVWREDGGCQMLEPPALAAVTCLAPGPGDCFLAGHLDGEVRAAGWDAQLRAAWSGRGGKGAAAPAALLAVAAGPGGNGVLAACELGLSEASAHMHNFCRLAAFPEPAHAARFDSGLLIACSQSCVTVWALSGQLRATLREPGVSVAALWFSSAADGAGIALLEEERDTVCGASS
mmetsp:Transcript_103358/g.287769  ORF Transcript_103358/g.287769 Transcript_103358/m.287769 type:complete len:458 (-) Transcript_103358:206-1579(-)